MLTTRLLHVHRIVVREGTLTAAAALLGYTVSAVSQQLAQLEAEAGVALYEKAGRGVRPTRAGELLAEHAERVLTAVEDAEQALSDLRQGRSGRLRIVSFHSAGESLLPQAVAALRRSMPGMYVLPVLDEGDGAMRRLRAGEVELVITVEPFAKGSEPIDDLRRVHLLDDEYRILIHADHAQAKRREVDVADLAESDWVVTTGQVDYVREALMRMCRRAGFTPRIVAEGDEFSLAQGYVGAGIGVALAPVLALGAIRENVVVRRLRTPPEPRHIWLTTRQSGAEQAAVRAMVSALRAAARTASGRS